MGFIATCKKSSKFCWPHFWMWLMRIYSRIMTEAWQTRQSPSILMCLSESTWERHDARWCSSLLTLSRTNSSRIIQITTGWEQITFSTIHHDKLLFWQVLNGTNVTIVSGSPLRKDPIYVTYYIFWSKFIFVEVIPYFTILVLNSLIIGKIYKSKQFRKRFVVRDASVSRMVLSVLSLVG